MKIEGKGRAGDFVHANQEMAAKEDFKNVSKLWYQKTISFEQAEELLSKDVAQREDIMCQPKEMVPYFDDVNGEVGLEYDDGRKFRLTPHAWRQFGSRTYIPHTFINMMLEPVYKPNGSLRFSRDVGDSFAFYTVLKNGHRRMGDKVHRFRTYKDGTCRAVLTEDYTPIDNLWYLEAMKTIVPDGRVSHFDKCNADTFFGNVLIPDSIREEDDSDYGGMISVGNCEIGLRAFEQYPSVFRAICMNGCIWDQEKGHSIRKIHRGKIDYVALAKQLYVNINEQIPLLTVGVEKLLETRKWTFGQATVRQVFTQIALDNKLSGKSLVKLFENYIKHENTQKNAFGVINSITRAGQELDSLEWVNFDKMAGRIMESGKSKWDTTISRAKTIDDVDKVLEKMLTPSMTA